MRDELNCGDFEDDNLSSRMKEITISKETKFSGRVISVEVKKVKLSDGTEASREIVVHNGGAAILPIDGEGNCYLVKQFRSPFEEVLLEVPAGKIEIGEEPDKCAERELREETGFVAESMIEMGYEIVSPGYDSEKIYLFLAKNLSFVAQDLDEGEFVDVVKIPFDKLLKMADEGQIRDSKTLICIYKVARLRNITN